MNRVVQELKASRGVQQPALGCRCLASKLKQLGVHVCGVRHPSVGERLNQSQRSSVSMKLEAPNEPRFSPIGPGHYQFEALAVVKSPYRR